MRSLLLSASFVASVAASKSIAGGWCAAADKDFEIQSDAADIDHYKNYEIKPTSTTVVTNMDECNTQCLQDHPNDFLACVEFNPTTWACWCLVKSVAACNYDAVSGLHDGGAGAKGCSTKQPNPNGAPYKPASICWVKESTSSSIVYINDGIQPTCCENSGSSQDEQATCKSNGANTAFGNGMDIGGYGDGKTDSTSSSSDSPCFGRDMYACLVNDATVSANTAFGICFEGASGIGAKRVPLASLGSGDEILDSASSMSRVIINEHVHSSHKTSLVRIHTAGAEIVATPDHYVAVGAGSFGAVGEASVLVSAAGVPVSVESKRFELGEVVNPITVSGKIIVATATGAPLLATTYGGWIAETGLRFGGVFTSVSLSNGLSYLFPASAQTYHDVVLEPLLPAKAVFAGWSQLFTATPVAFHPVAFVAMDLGVAAGFAVWGMCSTGGVALVAASMLMSRRK